MLRRKIVTVDYCSTNMSTAKCNKRSTAPATSWGRYCSDIPALVSPTCKASRCPCHLYDYHPRCIVSSCVRPLPCCFSYFLANPLHATGVRLHKDMPEHHFTAVAACSSPPLWIQLDVGTGYNLGAAAKRWARFFL